MQNDKEILLKLSDMELTINELYKEIIKIRKTCEDKNLEGIQIMTRLENIKDFIETKYNTSI